MNASPIKFALYVVSALLFLGGTSACSQVADMLATRTPTPTLTPTVTRTPTPTITLTPTRTFTPTLTYTPSPTPLPNVRLWPPLNQEMVLVDLFDADYRTWRTENPWTKIKIANGVMTLTCSRAGILVNTLCRGCSFTPPFYFQADVALDANVSTTFGLGFGKGFFYSIDPTNRSVEIDKFTLAGWQSYHRGESNWVRRYPASNTLAVFVEEKRVRFYLNGHLVTEVVESASIAADTLSLVSNSNAAGLIIDNVFAYQTDHPTFEHAEPPCPSGAPMGWWTLIIKNTSGTMQRLTVNGRSQVAFTGLNYIFFPDGEAAKVLIGGNTISYSARSCEENTLVIR